MTCRGDFSKLVGGKFGSTKLGALKTWTCNFGLVKTVGSVFKILWFNFTNWPLLEAEVPQEEGHPSSK